MIKRGFLRSSEGLFTLSLKITIIGRESCDFTIQNLTVDNQQAVIEYIENEDYFVLKDLNSTHGSYVNDCRIQNATVRLNDGDILKFGFSAGQYEFHTENFEIIDSENNIPLTSPYMTTQPTQKLSWQINSKFIPQQSSSNQITSFPTINYSQPQAFQHRHTVNDPGMTNWAHLPKAPSSLRSARPLSASSLNRRQLTPTAPPLIPSNSAFPRRGSISGPSKQFLPDNKYQQNDDQKLVQLQMEIERLRPLENEILEKSYEIESLIQQINDPDNTNLHNQIRNLSDELSSKTNEIEKLHSLLGKLTENSNRFNSNVSNNELGTNQISQQLEVCRKDLKISNGLVTTLQKDLSNRDETINKLTRDNQSLNQELSEKNISISVLTNKLSRMKDIQEEETEKQDREREVVGLRHKLTIAESKVLEFSEKIETLNTDLEKYQQTEKINSDAVRDLNKQLDEAKALITDLQRSESLLRVDAQEAEKKYERFWTRVLQIVLSTPGFKSSDHALKEDEVIDVLKELAKSKVEHDRRICEKQKQIDEANKKHQQFIEDIDKFKSKLKEYVDILSSGERTSNRVNEVLALSTVINVPDELAPLKDVINYNFRSEIDFLSGLELCISNAGSELANLSLSDCFKNIIKRSIDAVESKVLAEDKLSQTIESYEEKMDRIKQSLKDEFEFHNKQTLDQERAAFDTKLQSKITELLEENDSNLQKLTREFENKIPEYEENIENLKETLKENEKRFQIQIESLTNQLKTCEDMKNRVDELKKELSQVTEQKLALEQSLCEQFDTINLKWKAEIDLYKEETAQHAITIDSLNNRMTKLNKENVDLKNKLAKSKADAKKFKVNEIVVKNEDEEKGKIQENEKVIHFATIANLEKCIAALRHENVSLKNRVNEYEGTMKGLNMDLAGAEARLSDLKGELSESQKNEIDNLKIEIKNLEDETTDLRVQLAKLSGIVDRLKQELDDKKMENDNLNQHLVEANQLIQEKDSKIADIEILMKNEQETLIQNLNKIEQEGRIVNELAVLGAQCRGERHQQIIDAQKSALVEMRKKMKSMEITNVSKELGGMFHKAQYSTQAHYSMPVIEDWEVSPKVRHSIKPSYSTDVTLTDYTQIFPKVLKNSNVPEISQQMLEMKRELAMLRSKKAMRDSAPQGMSSLSEVIANKERTKRAVLALPESEKKPADEQSVKLDFHEMEKTIEQLQFDLDMEKSKAEDLQQSLDYSEKSYLSLLRQLGSILEMDHAKGLHHFANLSYEDKEALKLDREEICGLMMQKIRILKERIQRKEELLLGYEQDLVKLKQAEDVAVKTQGQLENIFQQMRYKGEEVELLRETLNRTKDLLNEEKRTNTAIKKHKHYVPDKSLAESHAAPITPKYHCPPEDILVKEKIMEKNKLDKNKRKDYEIKSLKSELYRKEKELTQATNRLYTLETSMGIKSEEPVS